MLFVSKRREFRLIIKPADRTFDEARRPMIIRGERVEFHNNRFKTEDEALVAYLKAHPLYGIAFTSADGTPTDKRLQTKLTQTLPQMIQGVTTTASVGRGLSVDKQEEIIKEEPILSFETPITKAEIEIMIENKMDSFLDRISGILQSQATAKQTPAPKKTFHCPMCHEEFASGVLVGKHKKLAHPETL